MNKESLVECQIAELERYILDPTKGLPETIFTFISRMTPLLNVDLLIKNQENATLLTWRNDGLIAPGWHIPGGIVRFKETMLERVLQVAKKELGVTVSCEKKAIEVNEIIHPSRDFRGHFISFLYECRLNSELSRQTMYQCGQPHSGQWAWHKQCPEKLLGVHEIYRCFI